MGGGSFYLRNRCRYAGNHPQQGWPQCLRCLFRYRSYRHRQEREFRSHHQRCRYAGQPCSMCSLQVSGFIDGGDCLPRHANSVTSLVSRNVVGNHAKNGASALGLQRVLGLRSYETAWTWMHKLRRAMVRPGRDHLRGRVEVDECYIGSPEALVQGRGGVDKTLVVVAVEEDGSRIGRIRLRQITNASAATLNCFIQDSVATGSTVHTDGWRGVQEGELTRIRA
jgi:ISXO2-like transposase domain